MLNMFKISDKYTSIMYWEDVGFLKASKNRLKVFKELSKGEKTPKELEEILDLYFSQISMILKELVERELIICLNKDSRKGKIYALSEKGKDIKKSVEKVGD